MNQSLGKHLILDVWGEINSMPFWHMDSAAEVLKTAVINAGATFLNERWHHFGTGFGYTGVIILAESHVSIHTWPEKGYAAIDIFMCGEPNPLNCLDNIIDFFKTTDYNTNLIERG
jgi:S-adenosylmethionine decarboxylase